MKKIKFSFEDTDALCAGVQVLVKAYRYYEDGNKKKIECVERAMRPYRTKYRLPGDEAMRDGLTDVIRQVEEGRPMDGSGERNMARTWVINEALKVLGIQEPEQVIVVPHDAIDRASNYMGEEKPAEEQVEGQICMELPVAEEKKAEETPDFTQLMRLIAGKAGEIRKAMEQLHNDLTRIDDHICQVLRRSDW